MATRHGSATVTLPSDTELLITRSFEAPRTLVWDALTTPRHLLRWWGPDDHPLVACTIDMRPGGAWRFVSRGADGAELAWHGIYEEIAAPERTVSTEVFETFPDAQSRNVMTLTESEGVTTLRTLVKHKTRENRDRHVDSGMEGGMQRTFDRLDDLLAIAGTASERFRRVAGRFTDRAREVSASGWSNPAPCDGWTARDVVTHLTSWVPAVIGKAGIEFPAPLTGGGDPVDAWTTLADTLQRALDAPEVSGREFDAGPPGVLTVETAIDRLVLGDVLIHTWDLARATGLDEHLDDGIVADMLAGIEPLDELLRSSGHYGPKVAVPDAANAQTKLIAFTGRQP